MRTAYVRLRWSSGLLTAFEAHSVSVGGSPYGDDICPLEDLGLLERGRAVLPGLTPIAARLGDWLVWTLSLIHI